MLYDMFLNYDARSTSEQLYACCPFHHEKTASFTINVETHEWYCHSCGIGGKEVEFLTLYYDLTKKVAKHAFEFWSKKGALPFPTGEEVEEYHQALLRSTYDMNELMKFGITKDMIIRMKLGLDNKRIIYPIPSRTGYVVNLRKYLPIYNRVEGMKVPKCINVKGLGSPRYYPYEAFDDPSNLIYVVEGEKDMLVARSQGLNAVTGTGGSTIPMEEYTLFKGKDVILMLDTDAVGTENVKKYKLILRPVVNSLRVITLPTKDFTDYFMQTHNADVIGMAVEISILEQEAMEEVAQDVSLVRSEFTENLNTWVKLNKMSVIGVEPRIYSVPTKLRIVCKNSQCTRPCPLAQGVSKDKLPVIAVSPRELLRFIGTSDTSQDVFAQSEFGCKSATSEGLDYINVQRIIFQESASFIDGLEESSFEHRYGVYMYTDYRLDATMKYNFEATRVTDPKTQQNFYVIRNAEKVATVVPNGDLNVMEKFRDMAKDCTSAMELINKHYDIWKPLLAIEGRADLFGAILLTYCSITEIPWQAGIIKGWLDTMAIGDTRTGKSQMAQRFIKHIGLGGYINGENARRTGVIGGVQRFGDAWVITWGAIPMNDRGLLIIDEASGLEIDDVKDLSSTRSSGAVTINKVVQGEARARTRLLWLSNPRSGKDLSEFYWHGYGAFQEFIPVMEDQARFDLVVSAAREDIDVLEGIDTDVIPDISPWATLFSVAWTMECDSITFSKEFKSEVRDASKAINEALGGGPLVIGVAVHEKLLRLACAFAVLCGEIRDGKLYVGKLHLDFAVEFLSATLNKPSMAYGEYIREFKRAQSKQKENVAFVRTILGLHPALRVLLASNGFKGFQMQEMLGLDKVESSQILSDLVVRGLIRPTASATYVPDKMLMEIAKQMEV